MDEKQIDKLIEKYRYRDFCSFDYDEWEAITLEWNRDMVRKIIRRIGAEYGASENDNAIQAQLGVVAAINNAHIQLKTCFDDRPAIWEYTAEMSLLIRAGEFLDPIDNAVPVSDDDKSPDYDALMAILSGYKDMCQKMAAVTNEMKMKMERDADYVKQIEKMNKYYKDKLNEKDGIITDLESKIDVLGGNASANGVASSHNDLNAFVDRLIEQADKEMTRERRESFYLYLTSVFRSIKHKLPEGTMDALEKLKLDKPANNIPTFVATQNVYNAGSVHDDKSRHLGLNGSLTNQPDF